MIAGMTLFSSAGRIFFADRKGPWASGDDGDDPKPVKPAGPWSGGPSRRGPWG